MEKEVGFNVVKEFWESSTKYCTNIEFDEEYNGQDNEDVQDVLTMFGKLDSGELFVAVKRGAVTRWWSIGEAADTLLKTLPMRRFMAKNYDDTKTSGKAKEIAHTFLSLSKEPTLIFDFALIKSFHRHYVANYMKFFKTRISSRRRQVFKP
jgi:hypothetical protein